jgi:hypothetical protein
MRSLTKIRTLFPSFRAVYTKPRFPRAFSMASITVHNSLKPGSPVPFVPREEGKVSWYACGPTTYDLSHLGHARNYVSTDIIRRILIHHFGFNVNFVVSVSWDCVSLIFEKDKGSLTSP